MDYDLYNGIDGEDTGPKVVIRTVCMPLTLLTSRITDVCRRQTKLQSNLSSPTLPSVLPTPSAAQCSPKYPR